MNASPHAAAWIGLASALLVGACALLPELMPVSGAGVDRELPPVLLVDDAAAQDPVSASSPLRIDFGLMHITKRVEPVYPPLARLAHVQGEVLARATIDAEGVPIDVRALSGPDLLKTEALRAVSLWCFSPVLLDGCAVPATFTLPIRFDLH